MRPIAFVTVTVHHVVRPPLLALLGDLAPTIPVRSTHDEGVDIFPAARRAGPGPDRDRPGADNRDG